MGRREGAFEEGVEETIVVAEDKGSGFKIFRFLLNSVVTLIRTEHLFTGFVKGAFYILACLHEGKR